ncbi:hypothetical protein BDZ89DRAFT_970497, partial [Hymenopellis radicata]
MREDLDTSRNARRRREQERRKAKKGKHSVAGASSSLRLQQALRKQAKIYLKDTPPKHEAEDDVIRIYPSRSLPDGLQALGTRSLQVAIRIGQIDAPPVAGRLDSGADITLISEEYCLANHLPGPKDGIKMRLYQLTSDAKVLGYIRIPIYATNTKGNTLCFSVEAYVVRGMQVPILLGEDFQTSYCLDVLRNPDGDHTVRVGRTGHTLSATGSRHVPLGFEIRKVFVVSSVGRKAVGQKALHRKLKWDREEGREKGYMRAAHDYTIPANSVYNIEVRADFQDKKEWLVEKVVLGQEDGSILAAPLTWISSGDPRIPMANPSTIPRFIEEGEI